MQKKNGFKGVNKYWKKYERLLVLDILSKISTPSIVDFGAGQTIYDDPEMLKSIQDAFSDKSFIFLILPCEDPKKSKKILQQRMEHRNFRANRHKKLPLLSRLTKRLKVPLDQIEVNNSFIDSPSNFTLASHIVYTNNSTPREISEAIKAIYSGIPLPQSKVKIIRNPNRVKTNNCIPQIPYQKLLSVTHQQTPIVRNSNPTHQQTR